MLTKRINDKRINATTATRTNISHSISTRVKTWVARHTGIRRGKKRGEQANGKTREWIGSASVAPGFLPLRHLSSSSPL